MIETRRSQQVQGPRGDPFQERARLPRGDGRGRTGYDFDAFELDPVGSGQYDRVGSGESIESVGAAVAEAQGNSSRAPVGGKQGRQKRNRGRELFGAVGYFAEGATRGTKRARVERSGQ